MLQRSAISLLIAVALMALLVGIVGAQSATDDFDTLAPSIIPMGGGIVQAIPLTLTVNVPGPNGTQIVEVPIVLSLDIQIALGNVLTTSVTVTTEVPGAEAAEPVAEAAEDVEPTVPPPTTPTPTPIPPTATPVQPTPTPTEAAPTPAPAGQDSEAEATEAPEEEPAAEADEEQIAEEEAAEEGEEEATPEPDTEALLDPDNCSDSRSMIFAPAAGDVISGTVEVFGTAMHEAFNYYKLEYQQTSSETGEFSFIMDNARSITDGLLAELDTVELDNGAYVLRLTVVDNTGNFPPQCSVPVEIAN